MFNFCQKTKRLLFRSNLIENFFVLLALSMSGEASSIRVKAHVLNTALHAAVIVESPNGIGVSLLVAIEFNNTSLETIIIPSTLVSETSELPDYHQKFN